MVEEAEVETPGVERSGLLEDSDVDGFASCTVCILGRAAQCAGGSQSMIDNISLAFTTASVVEENVPFALL